MHLTSMTLDELRFSEKTQIFDRKSARISSASLVNTIISFANADGGLIAIGIEENGDITGINEYQQNINELLTATINYCRPSLSLEKEYVDCIDYLGNKNRILLLSVPLDQNLYTNNRDESFLRVGDHSKKLSFDERLEFMYSKGAFNYENTPLHETSLNDLDFNFIAQYCKQIKYPKTPEEYIEQNGYTKKILNQEKLTVAAVLLFAKNPQQFMPRARVRFTRYDGVEEKFGSNINVIQDRMFSGRILDVLRNTLSFVETQIKRFTNLDSDANFFSYAEYPKFVWKELIVNAIAHRDYSLRGTDIQIKMFNDHITVESPGRLPSMVRIDNIRKTHYSRNPKIAQFLFDYNYVREFGEGVNRIFKEMKEAGLKDPEYKSQNLMLYATIRNQSRYNNQVNDQNSLQINNGTLNSTDKKWLINGDLINSADKTVPINDNPINSADKTVPINDNPINNADKIVPIKDNPINSADKMVLINDNPINSADKIVPIKDNLSNSADKMVPINDNPINSADKTVPINDNPVNSADNTTSNTNHSNFFIKKEITHKQKQAIFEYVNTNTFITTQIVCSLLGIKERRARNLLSDLCQKGTLRRIGSNKNSRYIMAIR